MEYGAIIIDFLLERQPGDVKAPACHYYDHPEKNMDHHVTENTCRSRGEREIFRNINVNQQPPLCFISISCSPLIAESKQKMSFPAAVLQQFSRLFNNKLFLQGQDEQNGRQSTAGGYQRVLEMPDDNSAAGNHGNEDDNNDGNHGNEVDGNEDSLSDEPSL